MRPTEGKWRFYWRRHENGEADCGIFAESRAGHAVSIARCPRYEKNEQWEANATLMCAAPDMLAELKGILTFLEDEIPWVDRNDPPAKGTMERAATDLAERIAALIKRASGEL